MSDPIDRPVHYTSHPSGVEAIEICEHLCFRLGNAFKYLFRRDMKKSDGGLSDLRKALWYLKRHDGDTGGVPGIGALGEDSYQSTVLLPRILKHEPWRIASAMLWTAHGLAGLAVTAVEAEIAARSAEREEWDAEHGVSKR